MSKFKMTGFVRDENRCRRPRTAREYVHQVFKIDPKLLVGNVTARLIILKPIIQGRLRSTKEKAVSDLNAT